MSNDHHKSKSSNKVDKNTSEMDELNNKNTVEIIFNILLKNEKFLMSNEYMKDFNNIVATDIKFNELNEFLLAKNVQYEHLIINFLSNWMYYLPNELKSKFKLINLLLPGTHNTCSNQIIWSVKPICLTRVLYYSSKLPLVRNKVENIVINQTKNLREQFEHGARLFDLRLSKSRSTKDKTKYYISHTYYVCDLETCLNQIKYCLNSYKDEVCVVNAKVDSPYRSFFTSDDINNIFEQFKSELGDFILPLSIRLNEITISELIRLNKRLVIYWNLTTNQISPESIDHQNVIRMQLSHEIWPNEPHLERMVDKLNTRLTHFKYVEHLEFVYFSFNVTPNAKTALIRNHSATNLKQEVIDLKESYFKDMLHKHFIDNVDSAVSGVIFDDPTFNLVYHVIMRNYLLKY